MRRGDKRGRHTGFERVPKHRGLGSEEGDHGVLESKHRVHFSFLYIPFSKHFMISTLLVVLIFIMF